MTTRRAALALPVAFALVAAGIATARLRVEPEMAEVAKNGVLEPGAKSSAIDAARRDVLARVN